MDKYKRLVPVQWLPAKFMKDQNKYLVTFLIIYLSDETG